MDFIGFIMGLLSDPRTAIAGWIVTLGPGLVYSPLFLIVFIETGVVVFPFLPGDSLLFAAGVFSADGGGLNIWATLIVFYAAAILGNTSNYWIARLFGSRIIDSGKIKALTPERMAKLDEFFARYGGLTIVITRFMPFFRTFAPFIAGTGHMRFGRFTLFNAIGGVSWVSLFVLVGYFFGGIPLVQQHFEVIVLGIVGVSVLPALIGAIRTALKTHQGTAQEQALRDYRTGQLQAIREDDGVSASHKRETWADADARADVHSQKRPSGRSAARGKHARRDE